MARASAMTPPMMSRRPGPLPPLDAPRGAQVAAVNLASAAASSIGAPMSPAHSAGYPFSRHSPHTSLSSSRASASPLGSSWEQHVNLAATSDRMSRSTSASSHRSGFLAGASGSPFAGDLRGVGDLFNTIVNNTPQESPQADIVVKAMLPIVRRAMISQNKAVFQVSLDAMRRIERMFGQEAIDQHIETLVEASEKQCGTDKGGDVRAARIFETLVALCSKDKAATLRKRFPQYAEQAAASSSN